MPAAQRPQDTRGFQESVASPAPTLNTSSHCCPRPYGAPQGRTTKGKGRPHPHQGQEDISELACPSGLSVAWAQSWGWGTFLAQGGEMLGTGGRNRSQKSCGQMRKPHESELNSQTPQLSAHVQLPRASQHPRLLQAPEGTRPPPSYP